MHLEQAVEILKGLLTPLIAVVTAYIAWQQWQTNRQKLIFDIYERRLHVYEEVRKILSIILRDGTASHHDLLRFRTSVSEADFLFGREITEYIDEIYKRGLELQCWHSQYRDYRHEKPEGYDHKRIVEGMHSELGWFSRQFEPAKSKFKKYLYVNR